MFILDFDSTLFYTDLLKKDLKHVFSEYGVNEKDYASSEAAAVHGYEGNNYDYTLELHGKILEEMGYIIPLQEVIEKVKILLIENNYAYDDTISFLEALTKKNEQMVLLTAGNENFQRQKIQSIKIEKYFDEIVCIRGNKEEYVESIYTPQEKIFFINDKLKENSVVKSQREDICVVTKWNPLKNTREELEHSGIPYFTTLTEIFSYIEHYGK